MSAQHVLFAVGAVLEFAGIVALAFPDFVPYGKRLSAWLRERAVRLRDSLRERGRRVANLIRRLIGRPLQPIFRDLSAAGTVSTAATLSVTRGIKGVSAEATLDEKIAFLIERAEHAQLDRNVLTERIEALEAKTPRQLEELRGGMEAHVTHELATAQEEYRPLRISGTIALAVGLGCATAGNFL